MPNNDLLNALKRRSNEATNRLEQARHLFEKCVVSFFEGGSYHKTGIVCLFKNPKERDFKFADFLYIVDRDSATLNLPGSGHAPFYPGLGRYLCTELTGPSNVVVDLGAAEATEACAVDLVVLVSGKASEVVPPTPVPTKTKCQLCGWLRQGLEEAEKDSPNVGKVGL